MKHKKLFLYMILFICPLALSAQDLDRKISFSVKNKDLKEVITLISKKTGISFSYNPETIPRKKITIAVQDQSIRNILNQLLLPEDIEYRLVEDHVILRKKAPDKNQPPEFRKEATKFTISGFLRDKSTGEPLIGATVYDKDNFIGTASNPYGFYSLTLPGGSYRIMISFVGYSKKEVLLQLKENLKINFELEALQQDIREVEVLSKKERSLSDDQSFRLSAAQMTALPGFAGEQDLIRSLQVVPGIQNYGDGSTLFYVRGGNADQNLILIDDAPIFNPGHMFGFFSVLAPEAIREMEI
ncbi:MAG: carboxypeptidase-like regulatory domain-containing protein, partial [Syntrophothermus sp.]